MNAGALLPFPHSLPMTGEFSDFPSLISTKSDTELVSRQLMSKVRKEMLIYVPLGCEMRYTQSAVGYGFG